MEHNEAKREAFHAELDALTIDEIIAGKGTKTKDCDCESCDEELRYLHGNFLKYDMNTIDGGKRGMR